MKIIAIILLFLFHGVSTAQLRQYTFEEAEKLAAVEKRPYLIFIKTDWCKFCKIMERTTLTDPQVIEEINNSFYFIAFNAESKEQVILNGRVFKFKPTGKNTGMHEIVSSLFQDENVAFPALVMLNNDYSIRFAYTEYLSPNQFLKVLTISK